MEPNQEQIIQDPAAEKMKLAATAVAAAGAAVGNTLMTAVKEAATPGEKAVVFGAISGFVAFFLPWVSVFGMALSGYRAAVDVSALFWLYPVSMIVCFFLALTTRSEGPMKRILAARWFILIGTIWFTPSVAALNNMFSGAVGFGGYLAAISAGAILTGGFLQINERLQLLLSSADRNVEEKP